jgi:hypothetical protein
MLAIICSTLRMCHAVDTRLSLLCYCAGQRVTQCSRFRVYDRLSSATGESDKGSSSVAAEAAYGSIRVLRATTCLRRAFESVHAQKERDPHDL